MPEIKDEVVDQFCVSLYDKILREHGTSKYLFNGSDLKILYFMGPNSTGEVGYRFLDDEIFNLFTTVHSIAALAKYSSSEMLAKMKADPALMYMLIYSYRKAAQLSFAGDPRVTDYMRFLLVGDIDVLSKKGIRLASRNNGTIYIDKNPGKTTTFLQDEIREQTRRLNKSQVISFADAVKLNEILTEENKAACDKVLAEAIANGSVELDPSSAVKPETNTSDAGTTVKRKIFGPF